MGDQIPKPSVTSPLVTTAEPFDLANLGIQLVVACDDVIHFINFVLSVSYSLYNFCPKARIVVCSFVKSSSIFSPLGKLAERAIYFADVFSLFYLPSIVSFFF